MGKMTRHLTPKSGYCLPLFSYRMTWSNEHIDLEQTPPGARMANENLRSRHFLAPASSAYTESRKHTMLMQD
jgi:hypothetical protein